MLYRLYQRIMYGPPRTCQTRRTVYRGRLAARLARRRQDRPGDWDIYWCGVCWGYHLLPKVGFSR